MISLALLASSCLSAPMLFQMTPTEIDAAIQTAPAAFQERLEHFSLLALETPYHDGPLGEGPGAPHDPDPLVDFARVDCVTYVEQSIALAAGASYEDSVARLQRIRYRDGEIDFATRNHFMIADWIVNNPWCRDITAEVGETCRVTRSIDRAAFFRRVDAPELGQEQAVQEVTVNYLPIEGLGAIKAPPTPSLIVFLGVKPEWLFALHCGFLLEIEGEVRLVHASSKQEKVVAVPLSSYLGENEGRYLGATLYEVTPMPR